MAVAYIGLGSNIGDREAHLKSAVDLLGRAKGITLRKTSSIYETAPVGYTDQPDFLNAVVEIETTLEPTELLAETKMIEVDQKRRRLEHWGPRTLDLDILLYDQLEVDLPRLKLPHPEASSRAFVLVPLAEIAADSSVLPGKTAGECLADLGDTAGVDLYKRNWVKLDL